MKEAVEAVAGQGPTPDRSEHLVPLGSKDQSRVAGDDAPGRPRLK